VGGLEGLVGLVGLRMQVRASSVGGDKDQGINDKCILIWSASLGGVVWIPVCFSFYLFFFLSEKRGRGVGVIWT
jgi:hypothetical protein